MCLDVVCSEQSVKFGVVMLDFSQFSGFVGVKMNIDVHEDARRLRRTFC